MTQWMRRILQRRACELDAAQGWLRDAGLPYVRDVFLPDAEGGMLIPHFMLTPEGFCSLELQCMKGVLYGSEHSLRWSRFAGGRRHHFDNPLLHIHGRETHLRRVARLDSLGVPSQAYLVVLGDVAFHKAWPVGVVSAEVLQAMLRAWQGRPIPSYTLTAWRVFLSMFVHEPVNSFGQCKTGTLSRPAGKGGHV
ncbi:MAG: nuclease-related domain-containing protein [Halothiobacillaceae bacterium]